MRHDDQTNQKQETKHCAICGRLISSHVRNYEQRKCCSKSCKDTRLDEVDHEIEQEFVTLAIRDGAVECSRVQQIIAERLGRYGQTSEPSPGDLSTTEKAHAGNEEAIFRERVRRAARRVVNGSHDDQRFVCWSNVNNRIEEPSFAKGEWSVKYDKR